MDFRYILILASLFLTIPFFAQPGQIPLPRVELMPNQPAPYNMRDWEDVALKYDSFVYDLQKTGQYLPFSHLMPAGINYPQNKSFRLHTYVGTNSPFGNEAINVMPSLVGASLLGVDKSDQFGEDWLLMSQDFFNKANGENIYLNNAGASSGGDWWYDMMPNIYFYQLYDLYPSLSSEADYQFTTIADRFLEAVRAMDGSEAPWQAEKMLNWSFDKGNLRGWGTIVGTWGGFDVSGLIGEANDNGNDYAFQMNGAQQAAALVPMVRYDKRFARAIGKWMLNLANANRLFFPGFLPASLQDASAWSAANDPDQVIGYEALREVWQGNSPLSTGDAVQGGWAATNLALYGTSSIGYLGALVEKTDVTKILQIDLLATDFFRSEAYPTYLIYNSYNTAKSVSFDAGSEPADLYEALSETFILENVTGTVSINIPANQAVLLTITPAGGEISYELNRMLVDGVVVDFSQSAQAFTWPPRIKGLAAADNPVEIGDATTIYATVSDPDSGEFTYQWSTTMGSIEGDSSEVIFTAPAAAGDAEIQLIVNDPEGNSDTATLILSIVPEINDPPHIAEILKSLPYVGPGESLELTCLAEDPDADPLTYEWTASGGSLSGSGSSRTWTAPLSEGIFLISVKVADDQGLFANASTTALVKIFNASAGDLIAHYPFTGNAEDVSGNELHGEVNGAILTVDQFGVPQRAYYFNGGTQHIEVANDPLLNFQDGITVHGWFSADALPEKETFLLSHGSWQSRWKLSITPEKRLRWTVNTLNGIADTDGTVSLQTDSFYCLTATYEDGLMAIYLDGELNNYKTLSGKIRTTVYPFLMGQMLPGDPAYNFKGVLDGVKIYDYALTPDAVKVIYEQDLTSSKEVLPLKRNALFLSPNPVGETLTLTWPGDAGTLESVQVFDLSGRALPLENRLSGQVLELDLRGYEPGVYFLVCTSSKGSYSSRFIKL
ncbi:MAG: T9SS type A sorting domain-containing protein [Saprospirales bacterium]|nr:T9SS type A sorting domain-containing protein [Saprospirales bacterium]